VGGATEGVFVAAFFVKLFDAADNEFFECIRRGRVVVELFVDFRAVGFDFADVRAGAYLIFAGLIKALVIGVFEVVAGL